MIVDRRKEFLFEWMHDAHVALLRREMGRMHRGNHHQVRGYLPCAGASTSCL